MSRLTRTTKIEARSGTSPLTHFARACGVWPWLRDTEPRLFFAATFGKIRRHRRVPAQAPRFTRRRKPISGWWEKVELDAHRERATRKETYRAALEGNAGPAAPSCSRRRGRSQRVRFRSYLLARFLKPFRREERQVHVHPVELAAVVPPSPRR